MNLFFKIIIACFVYSLSFSYSIAQTTELNLDSLNQVVEKMEWKELDSIGVRLRGKYKFNESEVYLKKALKVAEKQHGKTKLYIYSCSEIGLLYYEQGLYEEAKPFWIEAKDISKVFFGTNHYTYTVCCSNLGRLYFSQGLYQKAELSYIEGKNILENILGKKHIAYGSTCHNLALLYRSQGLYKKAEDLFLDAIGIYESVNGKENNNYARTCMSLGGVYYKRGLYEDAEKLYLEAKGIQEKVQGKESLSYANCCTSLSILYAQQGFDQKAEPLQIEAKNILEKSVGKQHSEYASSCNSLAILYLKQKIYQKAEDLFLEAKSIQEQMLGKENPNYAETCNNLAILYTNQNLFQKAEPLYKEAIQNKANQVEILFPTFSEKEKEEYFSSIENYFSYFTDFATQYYPTNNKISQDLFNQQLFKKGIIFSSTQKMKQQILNSNDTVLINQYENWKTQKEEYISLLQTPTNERDSTVDLTKLAFQINELERDISKKSESFKQNTNQKEYTWLDAKQTLSKNEAIVEIIHLIKKDITGKPQDTVYVALIITDKTKESPELFVLKNGNELEKGAIAFYQNNIEFQLEDNESYNQYWKPIDSILQKLSSKGYSKIYFSPDGIYHKINLNVLQNPKTGKFLIDEQNIQLIASSRDLIEKDTKSIDLSKNFASYQSYLMGYPAYDREDNSKNSNDTTQIKGDNRRDFSGLQRAAGTRGKVSILEGTKVETQSINQIFDKKGISSILAMNKEASEENIKALKSPTILHIATHGFFIAPPKESEINTMEDAQNRNLLKNPFMRSGLLLAGCQNPPNEGEEDGILSAEEAMNLDLEGTELVVLSACETGLGDVENGEGVYGLQRAFQQAGAKTIVMSLWKVSDEATQILMTEFYENLLNGKSKREAFKNAQLTLRKKYPEPFYWGAFVMVGE